MPTELIGHCTQCGLEIFLPATGNEAEAACPKCQQLVLRRCEIAGYVYVLANASMPGLLKIGVTRRTVEERVAELDGTTAVPTPFSITAWFPSGDPEQHERKIHDVLGSCRVRQQREFFKISVEAAVSAVQNVTGAKARGYAPPPVPPPQRPPANEQRTPPAAPRTAAPRASVARPQPPPSDARDSHASRAQSAVCAKCGSVWATATAQCPCCGQNL